VQAFGRGAFAEAVATFTRAYDLLKEAPIPKGEDAEVARSARKRELALTRLNRAKARLGAGEFAEAEKDAIESSEIDPTYSKAKTILAEVYTKQGRLKEAEAALASVDKPGPGPPELPRLGTLLRDAAWRGLGAYALLLLFLLLVITLHRRAALSALLGDTTPLEEENLANVLRYSAGYGLGSFHARLRAEHAEDVSKTTVWKITSAQETEFISQAFGKQAAQDGGRLMLLYWGKLPQKHGKGEHSSKPKWIGLLALLPKKLNPAIFDRRLAHQATHGRLIRLGHTGRSWLQKQTQLGSADEGGLLPLAFHIHGTVADNEQIRHEFLRSRLGLVAVAAMAFALCRSIVVAIRTLRDFNRHPAMDELSVGDGKFTRLIEKELNEDVPQMQPRILDNGQVIITLSWLIYLPGNGTFFSRLFQPLLMLTGLLGTAGGPSGPPGATTVLRRIAGVFRQLPNWFRLLGRSLPGSVQVSPLWECQLGLRKEPQASPPHGQVILWDEARGHFADVMGDIEAMETLAKEIGTRQGVATRVITSSAIAEIGGAMPAMAESSIDPRCMSLDRCYEALQLSREELKQKPKEEAKEMLARAFRLRVVEDPNIEKRKVEELALALDLLMRRLCLSLEM
ncbi:unnamed protein product, partial [Symbiodinium natans]